MALNVKHGRVVKQDDYEKLRVAYVANVKGDTTIQFVTATLMLRRFYQSGIPRFGGPVYAGWENLRTLHGKAFAELELIGAIAAVPDGEWKGDIDWIKPVDGGKIMEQRRELTKANEPEAAKTQTIELPLDLRSFAENLMFDPQLNAELKGTAGGADMLLSILQAAVRLAKEEA